MPYYTATVRAFGWFSFTAEDDDEAAEIASSMTKSGVPIGTDFDYCEVEDIELDEGASA